VQRSCDVLAASAFVSARLVRMQVRTWSRNGVPEKALVRGGTLQVHELSSDAMLYIASGFEMMPKVRRYEACLRVIYRVRIGRFPLYASIGNKSNL
jgi:hypothetical protein